MRFLILMPGKLRAGPTATLIADYADRCRKLGSSVELGFVREQPERKGSSREVDLDREAAALLDRVPAGWTVVALDEHGEQPSSTKLAARIGRWRDEGVGGVALLIGSARGIGRLAVERAQFRWSLSRLTLPHELAAVVAVEQVYRALMILAGRTYHR